MNKFSKIMTIGNDYIVTDNIQSFPNNLCDRHFGIGADGIINILPSAKADYKIEVFNANCEKDNENANALICSAKYYVDKFHSNSKTLKVETSDGIKILELSGDSKFSTTLNLGRVSLATNSMELNTSRNIIYDYQLSLPSLHVNITYVRVNYPHVIVFKNNLFKLKLDLKDIVNEIQNDNLFKVKPYVSFINLNSYFEISVETFNPLGEEILSCGESAIASVYSCIHHFKTDYSINVKFKEGLCHCFYDKYAEHFFFTSTAETLFEGIF